MSWSYVGLLAAAVAESSTRYLNFDFGWTVAIATTAVVLVGSRLISANAIFLFRYNLYHVLNHLNLFGHAYLGRSQNMISSLLAQIR
jgi:hypothetical protein